MTYLLGWLGRNVECIALSVAIQHKGTDGRISYLGVPLSVCSLLDWTGPDGYYQSINQSLFFILLSVVAIHPDLLV